ncbi:hemin-degrading factor [Paracoccus sp. (in: a-proteobacteria)]|uniref:hemin-degrading factor n=1 Tax=Paracoccus sp. TaxID=267 RepID=UPI0026E0CE90|nr:ChuX/HutX family heme-like substrate-binding protein [Paracoccus sp. (in: a-proteobacteria)]MDO5647165.1 ChuX/HutX family heme-like substrate-binding protein [Paracoccus sp. (in: a-proteobacteria)]
MNEFSTLQLSPSHLRDLSAASTLRPYDLADSLNIPEAALVQARLGQGVTRISASPGALIPQILGLGDVMALTRNRSCVIEKIGTYRDFHDGAHAAMTLDPEIDLRIFPRHWVHAFAVETAGQDGLRRSIQVFDAAGDAVHKVYLRAESDLGGWDRLIGALRHDDQAPCAGFAARPPVEGPLIAPDRAEVLRREWAAMTDTHQFNTLVRRLKVNRLGAYRIAGAPFVRPLAVAAVPALIDGVAAHGLQVMMFVGNMGCIQIHSGGFGTLRPMGPWLNVMHPRFNLHLRGDHVAEVWAVDKPTKRGPARSVEAFDADGALIFQCFGTRPDKGGDAGAWAGFVAGLPALEAVA